MVRIERYRRRWWAVYDADEPVVVAVYERGAAEVARRLLAAAGRAGAARAAA